MGPYYTVHSVAPRSFQELAYAAARRGDVPPHDLPGGRIEQDRVRPGSVLVGREPDRGVEEFRILHLDLRARIFDHVDEILQQLALVAVDVFPGEALRLVLVDLRVQEARVAHHAAGVEGHLESEWQLVLPRREVAGTAAEDLPEIVAVEVPGPLFVRARPGEDPGVGGRCIDLEHIEWKIDAFKRGNARGFPEVVWFHDAALHPTLDRPQRAVAVHPRREHRVRQDERLVPANARRGAAVRTRHDHLARGQVQRSATLRAVDRRDELGHADTTLMGRANIEASG